MTPGVVDVLLVLLPGLIWGASFLFIAEGLDALAPNGVTFVRLVIGFLTLSFVPGVWRSVPWRDLPPIAGLGVLWMAFPYSMFPFAEQHVSSALAGMLNGSTPLFAVIVASGLSRQMPSQGVLLGLAVGLLGTVFIALPGLGGQAVNDGSTRGVLMIMAAMVSYGFAINLARPLQQRHGALPVVWRALGCSVAMTAPLGLPALAAGHWSLRPALALLALGALGTGLANVLVAVAAGRIGAARASTTTFLIPVVALILGVLVRGERVAWLSIGGSALCLAGAVVIQRARRA